MDPWTILGWLVLIGIGLMIAKRIFFLMLQAFARRIRHIATRDIPPAAGQIWKGSGKPMSITHIHNNGTVCVKISMVSWGESPEKWRERVRSQKLYLSNPIAPTKLK